jgi:hypothetical protein
MAEHIKRGKMMKKYSGATILGLALILSGCAGGHYTPAVPVTQSLAAPDAVQNDSDSVDSVDASDADQSVDALGSGAVGKGILVDATTNQPIKDADVGLTAWTPGAKVHWQDHTDAKGAFTVHAAPNKQYLLVITPPKSAKKAGITYPTIHDSITLQSGTHKLIAPDMPKMVVTPQTAAERSHNYRMLALDANSDLCLVDAQTQRKRLKYPPVSLDEWLLENTQQYEYWNMHAHGVGLSPLVVVSPYNQQGEGDTNAVAACYGLVVDNGYTWPPFRAYGQVNNAKAIWYAPANAYWNRGQWLVSEEAMYDPRGPLPEPWEEQHKPNWP